MALNTSIGFRGVSRQFAPGAAQGTSFMSVLPAVQGLGGGGLSGLAQSLNDQQRLTNEQNMARKAEIEGILAGLGAQEQKDIEQRFTNLGGQQAQRRHDAGLSVGSVADTEESATAQGAADALARARARIAEMRSGFLERISEEGPDFSVLSRLGPGIGAGMAGMSGGQGDDTQKSGPGGAKQKKNPFSLDLGSSRNNIQRKQSLASSNSVDQVRSVFS